VHQHINAADLIKKRDLLDPLEDDDDIAWKENPFEVDSLDESEETPESPNSSVKSAYGFHPRPRIAGDLIPNQAAFVLLVEIFMQDINKSAVGEGRVRMVIALFTFLLQPQFAAYHLGYKMWRLSVLDKCDELIMDHNATSEIRDLCRRFQELYGKA
jgi:hypothetical protein